PGAYPRVRAYGSGMTELTELVGTWMRRQRWYSTKSVEPRLRLLASFEAEPADADVRVVTHFFCDDAPRTPRIYQVPVVGRAARADQGVPRRAERGEPGRVDARRAHSRWLPPHPRAARLAERPVAHCRRRDGIR